uniref:Putative odorant receptor 4 n=1 Tax=Conopomorpha sinensis TaxID=940481 RepID=A0A3Q8HNS6_9NEOP|nr:putative odorant receptor 4 [Conopomorpha sinensis]
MWHGMLITVFVVVGDLLYSLMLNQISMQLDLLAVQLENIVQVHCDQQLKEEFPLGLHQGEANEVSGTPAEIATDRDETEAKLISIIKRHVVLIKLGEDVEGILSISLLINFVNSSMILCFCGYCCVLVEKWNELAYKSFLVTAMCQTFLLCWYGQKLLDASVRVSCAAYNCGWYVMSAKIRKYLLYIMMRAQKPVSVTAYGYCVIGFKCYTTIVKTAWSYFTLLLNVLK